MMFDIGKDVFAENKNKYGMRNRLLLSRLGIITNIFMFMFFVFIGKTLYYGLQHNDLYRSSVNNDTEFVHRADIVDRNGVVLAKSVKYGNIKLYPKKIKDKDVDLISSIVHDIAPWYTENEIRNLIYTDKSGVYIKKRATEEDIKKVFEVAKDCFDVEPISIRQYPKQNLFAHVVGWLGKDEGLGGVEYTYDQYLKENRDPLRLSVDSRVQNIFYEQLSIAMNKYQAKGAMGMLMDSRTGEMISMVQLPDYDPANINSYPEVNRRFKLLRDNYEMGSIFKIFNTALAYENGLQNKEYRVDKPLQIYDKRGKAALQHPIDDVSSFKRDIKKRGITKMKADDIMLHSCNVGSAQIAMDLPNGVQQEFFERINLDKALKLEFGKTEKALTHKIWGPVEHATASFGHGISVTPMHLLLAVNAMTNGGIYIYPTLLKRQVGAVRGERVLDAEISEKLRNIMFNIAEKTTAQKARVKGVNIGGKTGTAEKRGIDGKIDKNKNMTVFTGIFPVEAPQYIIFVALDEPKGTVESGGWKTAAWNAVPTAGKILDGILPLLFENF